MRVEISLQDDEAYLVYLHESVYFRIKFEHLVAVDVDAAAVLEVGGDGRQIEEVVVAVEGREADAVDLEQVLDLLGVGPVDDVVGVDEG